MNGAFNLGKVFGIQLRLHYSWFIIFVLLTFLLVSPYWYSLLWWAVGIAACLLFFGSVIAHELAHSLVGRANGIPVKSITLFLFGGVAQMTREAKRPSAELKMAAAGPLCSLAIGGVFSLISFLNPDMSMPVARMVQWLAFMNFALAAFNLIPGFPLDGGRLFRSAVWRFTGDYRRSTRIATRVGEGVGYAFIGGGITIVVLSVFNLSPFGLSWFNWFSGVWMAFIGWFLKNAASASYRQAQWRETLKRFTAAQVMTVSCPAIPSDITISQLVQEYVLPRGCHLFMAADEGGLQGILTLQHIKSVPRQEWDVTQVKDVVTPIDKLKTAHPSQDVLSVLEQMDESGINEVPVVSEGRVIGLIARDDLVRFLHTRSELGIK
ncbi:MAG: site-2 protease family protein [Dehalococcoidales bacterium]